MIRRARREDIPLLTQLWETAFGDSGDYISFFFQNRFVPQDTFLFERQGRPVSVFFLLDAQLSTVADSFALKYLYAACTAPAFRGQGLMRRLIDFAADSLAESGVDCIALVPASQGLFDYYAGCGFHHAFFCESRRLTRQALEQAAVCGTGCVHSLALPEMMKIRCAALTGRDYLAWDGAALDYALAEHRRTGGHAYSVRVSQGEAGYCMFHEQGGECFVQELLASETAAGPLYSMLLNKSDAHTFFLRGPVGLLQLPGRMERHAYGMLRPLSGRAAQLPQTLQNAYLGLSLG